MTRRRRVCFVLPSLAGGGAERAALAILNGMDDGSWDRSMYLFKREGRYLEDVSPSVQLTAGGGESRSGRLVALREYFRRTQPDVIVSFLSYASVLLAARLAGVGARVVFNQQTPMTAFLADRDYHWQRPSHRFAFTAVTRLAYAHADLVVVPSAGVADDLRDRFGVDRARVQVIHNPVDLVRLEFAAAEPLDQDDRALWKAPVIVTAGRLAEAKNMSLLVDAFALLPEAMDARLFILGEGEEKPQILEQARRHGIGARVRLCGFQQNPWRYLSKADVFVLTSRYEGFGNVLIEAMACGTPVIATSSPGTQEIVRDGVNGFLVEAHSPAAVASAIVRVASDPELRCRLAAGARASALEYALPAIVRQYESALEALAA
jgi:glycosyltransferase involved in cell wall biosynthesis